MSVIDSGLHPAPAEGEVPKHYHVAPRGAREAIEREGLKSDDAVYMWTDLGNAKAMQSDAMAEQNRRNQGKAVDYVFSGPHDIWEIDTRGLRLENDPAYDSDFGYPDESIAKLTTQPVGPERIKRIGVFHPGPEQGEVPEPVGEALRVHVIDDHGIPAQDLDESNLPPEAWHKGMHSEKNDIDLMTDHWHFDTSIWEQHKPDMEYVSHIGETPYYIPHCKCGWKSNIRSDQAAAGAWSRHVITLDEKGRRQKAGPAVDRSGIPVPKRHANDGPSIGGPQCKDCGGQGWFNCDSCDGEGLVPDEKAEREECLACDGSGIQTLHDFRYRRCKGCNGEGSFPGLKPCPKCKGDLFQRCNSCWGKGYMTAKTAHGDNEHLFDEEDNPIPHDDDTPMQGGYGGYFGDEDDEEIEGGKPVPEHYHDYFTYDKETGKHSGWDVQPDDYLINDNNFSDVSNISAESRDGGGYSRPSDLAWQHEAGNRGFEPEDSKPCDKCDGDPDDCKSCDGSGQKKCRTCKGTGQPSSPYRACETCNGQSPPRDCGACGGSGLRKSERCPHCMYGYNDCRKCEGSGSTCTRCRGEGSVPTNLKDIHKQIYEDQHESGYYPSILHVSGGGSSEQVEPCEHQDIYKEWSQEKHKGLKPGEECKRCGVTPEHLKEWLKTSAWLDQVSAPYQQDAVKEPKNDIEPELPPVYTDEEDTGGWLNKAPHPVDVFANPKTGASGYGACPMCDGGQCSSFHVLDHGGDDWYLPPDEVKCKGECEFCDGSGILKSDDIEWLKNVHHTITDGKTHRIAQVQRHCVMCKKVFDQSEGGEATGFCPECREKEGLVDHHSWSQDALEGHYGAKDDLPPAPGTAPIPQGHVRIYHATWADPEEIKSKGLLMSKAQESYERGSTEFPAIFGYAGHHPALEAHKSGGGANVVEFHLAPEDLDIGRDREPEYLEGARSTVTTMKDVPPSNIVAVHEPWHAQYRMIKEDPEIEAAVMAGEHDWTMEDENMKPLGDAIRRVKREHQKTAYNYHRHEGYYYHASASENRESILREGLRKEVYMYHEHQKEMLDHLGGAGFDVWKIDATDIPVSHQSDYYGDAEPYYTPAGATGKDYPSHYTPRAIDPSKLELVKKGRPRRPRGYGASKKAQLKTDVLERLTEEARPEDKGGTGGFSRSIRNTKPSDGYMVSDAGSEKRHDDFDIERPHLAVPHLENFIHRNSGLLTPKNKYFGGWLDSENRLCLDVSENYRCAHGHDGRLCEDRKRAYIAGITNHQEMIFHVNAPDDDKYLDPRKHGLEEFPELEEFVSRYDRLHKSSVEGEPEQPDKHYVRIEKDNGELDVDAMVASMMEHLFGKPEESS